MIRWTIVGLDWKTPLKGGGNGEGKNAKEACEGVKAWLEVHMPHLASHPFWRHVPIEEGKTTIVDFGSHSVFARLEKVEEGDKA